MQSGSYRHGLTQRVKEDQQFGALIIALFCIALVALFAWAMSSANVPPHQLPMSAPIR